MTFNLSEIGFLNYSATLVLTLFSSDPAESKPRATSRAAGKRCPVLHKLMHVKQTQPWHSAPFQQPFMDVLLVQLLDLRRRHIPPIRSNVPVRLRAYRN